MFPFWEETISPILAAARVRRVVEIGALRGENTVQMLEDLGADTELHVIDRWCYLGTARTEAEVHELAHTPRSPRFDLDTYKILTKFLRPGQPEPHVVRIGTA